MPFRCNVDAVYHDLLTHSLFSGGHPSDPSSTTTPSSSPKTKSPGFTVTSGYHGY